MHHFVMAATLLWQTGPAAAASSRIECICGLLWASAFGTDRRAIVCPLRACLRCGNQGNAGHLRRHPRRRGGIYAAAVRHHRGACHCDCDLALRRLQHFAAHSAVCGRDGDQLSDRRDLLRLRRIYRNVCFHPGQHPYRQCGTDQPEPRNSSGASRRRGHRIDCCVARSAWPGTFVRRLWRIQSSAGNSLSAGRFWIRRVAGGFVRAARRRDLYQGSRCGR